MYYYKCSLCVRARNGPLVVLTRSSRMRLLNQVGDVSGGCVFVARWNGATVRAKVLQCAFGGAADNLRYESRMAGLCHPNVVAVYGKP